MTKQPFYEKDVMWRWELTLARKLEFMVLDEVVITKKENCLGGFTVWGRSGWQWAEGYLSPIVVAEMLRQLAQQKQTSKRPEYRWALVPESGTKQFPSEWVEVLVLSRNQCWAMCRRRDTPEAMPFVRAVKDLRDKEPKEQP